MLEGLQYWTVCTITNGVDLTPDNVGKEVKWVSVLKDLETGRIHRVNQCSGTYVGDRVSDLKGTTSGWLYAEFINGSINGRMRAFTGGPKAYYTLAEHHPHKHEQKEQ